MVEQRIERIEHGVPQGIEIFVVDTSPSAREEARAAAFLDTFEQAEAARFVKPDDRSSFIFRRAARCDLSAALGVGALRNDSNGRPLAGSDWPGISFSSDDGCALLAFSRVFALGVDIERLRPIDDIDGVARLAFSAAEYKLLDEAPAPLRDERFLEVWTQKEAWLKGRGLGLTDEVTRQCTVRAVAEQSSDAARWQMSRIAARPGYVAALAWRRAARPAD
jgi:4'-phosphopantetheinyl transferase